MTKFDKVMKVICKILTFIMYAWVYLFLAGAVLMVIIVMLEQDETPNFLTKFSWWAQGIVAFLLGTGIVRFKFGNYDD